MAKRKCHGVTAAGSACQAAPLRDGKYCSAHDPNTPASIRFGSPEQAAAAGALGGRPRNPRAIDVLRERLEADIDRVLGPLFDALEAARGVVVGSGESAELVDVTDWPVRLAAVREILDRAYGKPKQGLEHTGQDGGPVNVHLELDAKQRESLADVLRGRPASRGE